MRLTSLVLFPQRYRMGWKGKGREGEGRGEEGRLHISSVASPVSSNSYTILCLDGYDLCQ